MHESDFDREIKAALDDIVDTAPKPPRWAGITGGHALLRREEAKPWYRKSGTAVLGAAAVAVLVVGVAGFIGSGLSGDHSGEDEATRSAQDGLSSDAPETDSLAGRWALVSYEVEGEPVIVEEGMNVQELPWIEFHETAAGADGQSSTGYFYGNTGCNKIEQEFAKGYDYSAGFLVLEEAVIEAGGCGYQIEDVVTAMLWGSRDGIEVLFEGDSMTLYGSGLDGTTYPLTFRRQASIDDAVVARTTTPPTGVEASCSGIKFDLRYTEGPELTKEEFLATPQGAILEAFFVGGEGEPESDTFHAADGFSIVNQNFVLGYSERVVVSDFRLDGPDLRGWGGCNAELAADELRAERWSVAGPIDGGMTTIPILVLGGACVEADGNHIVTQIIEIEVQEQADAILITAWTRSIPPPSADESGNYLCAGVGIELEAEAVLSEKLGDRVLLDAGLVPPAPAEIIDRHPPASRLCSTTDMTGVEFEDYAPSWQGLPDAVADTRNRLLKAAMACDLEEIVALAHDEGTLNTEKIIFWGAANDPGSLADWDGENGSLRKLVLALTTLPVGSFEGQVYDTETETYGPMVFHEWPTPAELSEGASLDDVWTADTLRQVAALNGWSVEELIADADDFGGYAGFRVGITEDGIWMYALAGD